jgi:hypothetical protein
LGASTKWDDGRWQVYAVFARFARLFMLGFALVLDEEISWGRGRPCLHPNSD